MPRDLIVRILGETSQFERSLARGTQTTLGFERTLKSLAITAKESANAQVSAAVRKDARLREEISTYRAIAAASQRGSREQVAAANLAARAERTLSRSLATTSVEAKRLSTSTRGYERDFSRASRGVLAGSGIFRSLGRSLAFASGGFLAFGGAAAFVRKSLDAARDAQVVNRQLAQQFKNNRRELEPYRAEIDKTSNALSALSGFTNDELKAALTTILRTQPNVTKAIRDEATAADLARAKRIGLAQAALVLAKVEGGNTTLLRRQGIQVAKNATAEQALAVLRQKVGGQARAGATEQERFGAILHNTEEIIGTGLLPTLNKYLTSGSRWLEQMNESGKLERIVRRDARELQHGIHDASTAVHDAAAAIRAADHVTGGFVRTVELLLALKIASTVTAMAASFRLAALQERQASREALILRQRLALLPTTIVITVALEVLFNKNAVDRKVTEELRRHGLGALTGTQIKLPANVTVEQLDGVIAKLKELKGADDLQVKALEKLADRMDKARGSADQFGNAVADAGVKAAHGLALAAQAAGSVTDAIKHPVFLTRSQQNQFFDARISRELGRVADQGLPEQVAALNRIEQKLRSRLAKTKDITRQQNLEDQILEIERQKKGVRSQIRQGFLDSLSVATGKADFRVQVAATTKGFGDDIRALEQLQRAIKAQIKAEGATTDLEGQLFQNQQNLAAARASQISGRQFAALGLTATGDQRTPGVRALRRALGNVETDVAGTFLDTKKTRSLLSAIRRILSGGLGSVGEDVRAKIQSILGDLNRQLDNSTQKNLTKWRHLSEQAFLAGVPDLTPAQRRILEKKFAALGPGGTVPPKSTPAFALQRGDAIVVHTKLDVDGETMARNTTSHQIKRSRKRTVPRAG